MASLGETDNYNILIKSTADNKGFTEASEATNKLNTATEKTSKFAGLAATAHTAFGVAAGMAMNQAAFSAVGFAKSTIASFEESQNQIAQTNAVLKSTGGAAGVTAQQVDQLSKSWEHQTRYSDEAVRSAENMLLTFTNIHKDVFPQTTKAVIDMSTAMHQDLQTTAIQVGKALQDPVLGATALQRVGVRLTQSQKDTIKSMVALGNTAGAQKIILKELQTEFGNSAVAAGDTFAGSVDKLKNRFDDMKENMGQFMIKEGTDLFVWFQTVLPRIESVYHIIADYLRPSLQALSNTVNKDLMPALEKFWHEILEPLMPVIGVALVVAIHLAIDALNIILKAFSDVMDFLNNHVSVIYGVATAFGILATKMAFDGIVSSFNAAIDVATTRLVTLNTFLVGFGGFAVLAGAAALAASSIIESANKAKAAWDNASSAAVGEGNSMDDAIRKINASNLTPTQKAAKIRSMSGFATGGFTGRGDSDEVAGVVHKGEYVVPKSQVDQTTGKPRMGGTIIHQTNHIYNQLDLNLANRELGWRLANV